MRPLNRLMKTVISRSAHLAVLAAVLAVPLVWSATASAESGAHRKPPPPPSITEVALADLS